MAFNQVHNAQNSDAVLREFLKTDIKDLVELEHPSWSKFKAAAKEGKVNEKGDSQIIQFDVRTNIKAGASSMDNPGGTIIKRSRWHRYTSKQVITHEIDDATYEAFQSGDRNVFTSMSREWRTLTNAFMRQKEFFLHGDGVGKVAVLLAETSATVLPVSFTPDGTYGKGLGVSQLKVGVPYDLYSAAGVFLDTVVIAEGGINVSTNTITLTTAHAGAAVGAGGYLTPQGSRNQFNKGFAYLFQTGTKSGYWQGIDVSNQPVYNTPSKDAGGDDISNALIELTLQRQAQRNGKGMNANLKIWTHPCQISTFKAPLWNLFRLSTDRDNQTVGTSIKSVRYEESIFEPVPQNEPDRMHFIDQSDLIRLVLREIGPLRSGSPSEYQQRIGANQTGAGVFWKAYGCHDGIAIDEPNLHALIVNLAVDTNSVAFQGNFMSSS